MRWAINSFDDIKVLYKDSATRKMNGGAMMISKAESGEELDLGTCKEISRACDRFFASRERLKDFYSWQQQIRKEKEAA